MPAMRRPLGRFDDEADFLWRRPRGQRAATSVEAMNLAALDIHEPDGLLWRRPERAFTQLGAHGADAI